MTKFLPQKHGEGAVVCRAALGAALHTTATSPCFCGRNFVIYNIEKEGQDRN